MAIEQRDLPQTYRAYVTHQLCLMRRNLIRIYLINDIQKWSIWWALTTCMSLQVFLEYSLLQLLDCRM